MKTVRRVGVGFAALALLLVASVIALPYVLALESVRLRVLAAVESSLHRKVEAGAIRLEVLSGLGMRIEDLVVHNPSGWQTPALATVRRLSVKLAFRPLLSRRLQVDSIEVEGPTLALERDSAGTSNVADLRDTSPPRDDGSSAPASATRWILARFLHAMHRDGANPADSIPDFLVARVHVSHGRFLFVDRQVSPGRTVGISLDDLDGTISDVGPRSTPRFELSGRFLADAGRNVFFRGTVGPPPPGRTFAEAPLHATFAARDLALARLRPYLKTPPRLEPGALSLEGTLDGEPRGVLKVGGQVALVAPSRSPAIPSFEATLALTLDRPNASLDIERSVFALARFPLTARGTIRGLSSAPRLDFRIATPGDVSIENIARLPGVSRSIPASMKLFGRLRFDAEVRGGISDLSTDASLDATPLSVTRDGELILAAPAIRATLAARRKSPIRGRVTAVSGRLQKLPFEDFVADWIWNEGALTLLPSFRAFGGGFRARFESDFANPKTETRIRVEVERVPTGPLAASFDARDNPLSGTLTANLSLSSRGLAPEAFSKTVRGDGRVLVANADLKTVELMPKLASALSTVGRILHFRVPANLESTRIQTIQSAVHLVDGRVMTPALSLAGQDIAVTADGWVGFDKTLAYEGRIFLGPGIVKGLGSVGRTIADELGRVSLPFRVSGDIASPTVDVDYSALLDLGRRLATQGIHGGIRGVAGAIREQIRDRMEGKSVGPADFLRRLFPGSLLPDRRE